MNRLCLGLLVGAMLLSSCQGQTATTTPTPSPVSATLVATSLPTATSIPAPGSDKSTVTGVLKSGLGTVTPAAGLIMYLGAILPEAKGTPFLATFDRTASPKSLTDSAGRFVFADVTPGNYALILDRVVQSYMLGDPKQSKPDLIIEAKAGQIVDLGDLVYASLPGKGP